MGYGDSLIATGLARGAVARGKRIAFGDGKTIMWSQHDLEVFAGNPNIASSGNEKARDIEWIKYYRGHRLYGTVSGGHWAFTDFHPREGEIFFNQDELAFAKSIDVAVILEPRVKLRGACVGANKQWPVDRYQVVADTLVRHGWACAQLGPAHHTPLLRGIPKIETRTFRDAAAVISAVELYIGPEGGLHHAAAATGTQAVIIFGGFNSPKATGYDWHHNLTVGEPCGSISFCSHCQRAMASITVDRVLEAALTQLQKAAA